MFEMAHLHEDALREYDELELCYLETGCSTFFVFSLIKHQILYIKPKKQSTSIKKLCPFWTRKHFLDTNTSWAL